MGLFSVSLFSCAANMMITPQIEPKKNVDLQIKGKITYEGNKEYLIRLISEDSSLDTGVTFNYVHNVIYGKKDTLPDIIALFNPLNLVGFPIGENTVSVTGKLEVMKGNEVIKTYSAACILEKTRNLFYEGETFSELRKKGLIAVRNNIEAQMWQDREFLNGLLTGR